MTEQGLLGLSSCELRTKLRQFLRNVFFGQAIENARKDKKAQLSLGKTRYRLGLG